LPAVAATTTVLSEAQTASVRKRVHSGTHRACPPEETLARITPVARHIGITRVADVTWLDRIGIPVYQAIRPNARTLSLSQGKGITPLLAKVSAMMESIELWHAEEFRPATVRRTRLRDMLPTLPYDPYQLALKKRHFLHPGLALDWVAGTALLTGETCYVPAALAGLDFSRQMSLGVPLFERNSNGLASGNTLTEAVLHGLYEVVERDSLEHWRRAGWPHDRYVRPETVLSPECETLLSRFAAAGVRPLIYDATGPTGVPCFHVAIYSPDLPDIFSGAGCHLDKAVALSRALSEAAQVRLTVVAGARDDLGDPAYAWVRGLERGTQQEPSLPAGQADFQQIHSGFASDLTTDLDDLVRRVHRQTGFSPLAVDLTRADLDIPVARVLAPGLQDEGAH
jgi:YcaO-like protein with predicted kinase domain